MAPNRRAKAGRRVFVALDLPDAPRAALATLAQMLPLPRRVAPESLHLTLAFLGALTPEALDEADLALSAIHAAPFEVALAGVGLFGGTHPRTAWAGVAPNPALTALHAKIESAVRRAGIPLEAHRYVPHVTLGRFPPDSADAPALERAVADLSGFHAGPWQATEFTLFESHLSPQGAEYMPLARYPLTAPG